MEATAKDRCVWLYVKPLPVGWRLGRCKLEDGREAMADDVDERALRGAIMIAVESPQGLSIDVTTLGRAGGPVLFATIAVRGEARPPDVAEMAVARSMLVDGLSVVEDNRVKLPAGPNGERARVLVAYRRRLAVPRQEVS